MTKWLEKCKEFKNSAPCPHCAAGRFGQVGSQASTAPKTGEDRLSIRCERFSDFFDTFLSHGRSPRASRNSAACAPWSRSPAQRLSGCTVPKVTGAAVNIRRGAPPFTEWSLPHRHLLSSNEGDLGGAPYVTLASMQPASRWPALHGACHHARWCALLDRFSVMVDRRLYSRSITSSPEARKDKQ